MKALLLDMDGLMIDSEGVYWAAARTIAAEYGAEVSDTTLRGMMGRKPIESLQFFRQELGLAASAETLLQQRNDIMLDFLRNQVQAQPGLAQLLQDLSGSLLFAIVTGAQQAFVDVVLKRLELKHPFALVQSSDGIGKGKPDPEIYLTAIKQLGLTPQDCCVLEDSGNGALAAKRAGAYTVAVPTEHTADDNFDFVDFVAQDLFAAARHIQQLINRH